MRYILRNKAILANVVAKMGELVETGDDWACELKKYKEPRNIYQNALLWHWHSQFIAWRFLHLNQVIAPEWWHYHIFTGPFTGYSGEVELPDGTMKPLAIPSSDLSKADFAEACTAYECWKIEETGTGFERLKK